VEKAFFKVGGEAKADVVCVGPDADAWFFHDEVDDGVDDDDEEEGRERASLFDPAADDDEGSGQEGVGEEDAEICEEACHTVAKPSWNPDVSKELDEEVVGQHIVCFFVVEH
jgi:hypothetical protein